MKILIATDIHGSAYWADKVVQQFYLNNADLLVLLGDIYNHGPRNRFPQDYAPMKVAEILNGIADKLIVVKGNCDSEVDQMISKFTFMKDNVLTVDTDNCGKRRLYFTHGHIYNKNNLPHLSAGDALFYGHFHQNEITEVNGVICVNVGSCALPKDNYSTYCLVDEKEINILTFDGNTLLHKDL